MDFKSTISILVVDDDAITRFIHKTLIESFDLITFCYEASNGIEALTVIKTIRKPPLDIILLDIDMPLMNGFEFMKSFQQLYFNEAPQIVMVSSSQNSIDVNRSIVLGIKKFVFKPITRVCLGSIISDVVAGRSVSSAREKLDN